MNHLLQPLFSILSSIKIFLSIIKYIIIGNPTCYECGSAFSKCRYSGSNEYSNDTSCERVTYPYCKTKFCGLEKHLKIYMYQNIDSYAGCSPHAVHCDCPSGYDIYHHEQNNPNRVILSFR